MALRLSLEVYVDEPLRLGAFDVATVPLAHDQVPSDLTSLGAARENASRPEDALSDIWPRLLVVARAEARERLDAGRTIADGRRAIVFAAIEEEVLLTPDGEGPPAPAERPLKTRSRSLAQFDWPLDATTEDAYALLRRLDPRRAGSGP